jgi:iron complex outermembrane receptor protein
MVESRRPTTGCVAWTVSLAAGAVVLLLTWPRAAAADGTQLPPQDLRTLSIEQLMEIDVTLATREPEPVRLAAAAIDVITGDDIRRAGVTTVADAIALADGVHVARFGNGSWATSARGFNARSANKLLVMIDGRAEYSPLFTGVFWNMLDYLLEDIERIEVIRGPGATLWGADAVNGVINIVTRHSRDTQGTYVALGSGNEDPVLADVRYGGTAGAVTYRVYGKYAHRDQQTFDDGEPSGDTRRRGQVGVRFDGGRAGGDAWLLKGDAFHSGDDFPDRPSGEFTELAVHGRWSHAFTAGSRLDVQSYYRREYRRVPEQLTHSIDTVDVDMQHAFTWRGRHRLVWGTGYRLNDDQTHGGTVLFEPADRLYSLFSAFAQDEIAVRPDRLFVTAGLKLEQNTFSGLEWQPNVRARVQLGPRQMLWSAVSRAVRRPTRLDVDVRTVSPTGELLLAGGGDAFDAEELLAGEIGYRIQPHTTVALDATLFVHRYDDLRSQELPPSGPPLVLANTLNGRSRGVELAATVQPAPVWRLHASYTYLDVSITRDSDSRDVGGGASEANDPRHQFALRTSFDLPRQVALDAFVRGVGALRTPRIPAFAELNLRLGWRATRHLELSLVGQDLLHDHHPEFGATGPRQVEFERSVRALAAFRY